MESINGYSVTREQIHQAIQRLRKMTYDQRVALSGLNERRAEIIVAGAIILREAMELLKIESITICERALREGVIVDWMLGQGLIEDRLRYQSSVRERSVLNAMRKFQVDRGYSEHVTEFALTLFDATQPDLHHLSPDAREILWAAAMLHDCGQYISNSSYHKHTYYLIRNGDLLGYTEADVEAIANLSRYHRKSLPKKKHDNYRHLSTKWHRRVVDQLHPIMRLAVALNRRQIGAVEFLSCELDLDHKTIHLHISPRDKQDDCALELWSIEQNKEAFEKAYSLRVVPVLRGE